MLSFNFSPFVASVAFPFCWLSRRVTYANEGDDCATKSRTSRTDSTGKPLDSNNSRNSDSRQFQGTFEMKIWGMTPSANYGRSCLDVGVGVGGTAPYLPPFVSPASLRVKGSISCPSS